MTKELVDLREELKLSEVRRAELVKALEFYAVGKHIAHEWSSNGTHGMTGGEDGQKARKALAFQRRPKILAVAESAEDLMKVMYEFPESPSVWGECLETLDSAIHAMEKE